MIRLLHLAAFSTLAAFLSSVVVAWDALVSRSWAPGGRTWGKQRIYELELGGLW